MSLESKFYKATEDVLKGYSSNSTKEEQLAYAVMTRCLDQAPHTPIKLIEDGNIWVTGELTQESCLTLQKRIMYAHVNIPEQDHITLHINSNGGDAEAGLAVASVIRQVQAQGRKIHGKVEMECSSMASVLLQTCDLRSMSAYGYMVLHAPRTFGLECETCGTERPVRLHEKLLEDHIDNLVYGLYKSRTKKNRTYYEKKFKAVGGDWFVNAETALAEKLVDEVNLG